ncbi:peptidyl-prolyl cis-trans isomerase G-like [Ptychodera flava]|uniref:peptidyl-prolyl cis-trans isomerase G-like n=1 Tax=Ptychodera flava TaxID=63121 RepID=UPI00396A7BA6
MEPPDLTSRAELMLASHVKSSQSRSSSGHIRSSTPDVAPSRESSLHRNSYREMRREQSLRNQIKSDISRETAPTNNQPSGYDHRRLNVQVNSSRDHLQPIELAESGADDIWIMRPDAKRSSRSPTQDKQDAIPDYRREVRIDPRQYQVQGNLNKLNVAKPTNVLEGSGEKPPPIPPRDPINIRRDSKVDTFDNHSRLPMAQGYHQLIERAPPTTFVADRQQESPYRHHNSDYHQQDNYRANQRLPSSEFSALPYNKSRDAININENIWRGSDPPDIDYRPHKSWHSHLQNHPSKEGTAKQDSRSPSKSQMKHHQKQTPADIQTPQNENDRRRERSRNENSKRNIPYTEKQHQRTDNNNSQVREALSEYVKNQYRNKDYKTAKDRYREETAQHNADERRRSQNHWNSQKPCERTQSHQVASTIRKTKTDSEHC